jgi:hypothetical protein
MSDLTDFLLARIAEDEAMARENAYAWLAHNWPHVDDDPEWEIALVDAWLDPARPNTPSAWRRFGSWATEADLRWMAARYADHPDYREEWADSGSSA